jgi:CheY-like chemotaxis protein
MPETIMIIDDDRAIAQLTSIWVKSAGFNVLIANDGKTGLKSIDQHRPNLILLDVRMPEMDGFEVNRRLREIPGLAEIPVIFLSAHAQEETRKQSVAGGGRCFLSKPYDGKRLIGAIRTVLAGGTVADAN